MPRALARRINSVLPAVEMFIRCRRPPVASASLRSRPVRTSSASAGMPDSPSTSDTVPSCITPLWDNSGTSRWSRIGRSNIRQYSSARRSSSELLIERSASVKPTAPAPFKVADLGQLVPFPVFADASQHEDIAVVRALRLVSHEFHDRRGIDRRLGVGKASQRSEASHESGCRPRGNRLVRLASRLPQLGVDVDQAGRDNPASGVDHLEVPVRRRVVGSDAAVLNQQVRHPVKRLTRIDHAAVLHQDS